MTNNHNEAETGGDEVFSFSRQELRGMLRAPMRMVDLLLGERRRFAMNVAQERFRTALDLFATAVVIRRQALRREYPRASDREIEQLLNRWLATRPCAEYVDGPQPATRD